jgi:low affinity Fe/Cu permease
LSQPSNPRKRLPYETAYIGSRNRSTFSRFAKWSAHATGLPSTFFIALTIIIIWATTGPLFHYSDTWQLVINTGTTIVTFLMVFLIQNTQNRDSKATQIKLDEIIRAIEGAQDSLIDLEELEEEELEQIRVKFEKIARDAREMLRKKGHVSDAAR